MRKNTQWAIACFVKWRYSLSHSISLAYFRALIKQTRAYRFYFNEQQDYYICSWGVRLHCKRLVQQNQGFVDTIIMSRSSVEHENRKWQTINKSGIKAVQVIGRPYQLPKQSFIRYSCCIVNCTDSLFLGGSYANSEAWTPLYKTTCRSKNIDTILREMTRRYNKLIHVSLIPIMNKCWYNWFACNVSMSVPCKCGMYF